MIVIFRRPNFLFWKRAKAQFFLWCDQEDLNLHSFELEPKSSASAKTSQTALHFNFCLSSKVLSFVCLFLFPKNNLFLGALFLWRNCHPIIVQHLVGGATKRTWTSTLSNWNLNPARLPLRHKLRFISTFVSRQKSYHSLVCSFSPKMASIFGDPVKSYGGTPTAYLSILVRITGFEPAWDCSH